MPLFRRIFGLGKRTVLVHSLTCGVFVSIAAALKDQHFEQRWRGSVHAAMKRDGGYFSRTKALSNEERECLEAWLDLMRFRVDPSGNLKRFSAHCALNDTLMFFDGLSECADGFLFLSYFYEASDPVIQELRREETGGVVTLHAKLSTDAKIRWIPISYTFVSTVTLVLEDFGGLLNLASSAVSSPAQGNNATAATSAGVDDDNAGMARTTYVATSSGRVISLQSKKRIRLAEHRWFGGPIVSRFTSTFKNSYGDMGDLFRRCNGFVLSTVMTNSEFLTHAHGNAASGSQDNTNASSQQ